MVKSLIRKLELMKDEKGNPLFYAESQMHIFRVLKENEALWTKEVAGKLDRIVYYYLPSSNDDPVVLDQLRKDFPDFVLPLVARERNRQDVSKVKGIRKKYFFYQFRDNNQLLAKAFVLPLSASVSSRGVGKV